MKMNFKYVSMLACAAVMAGFASCSSDNNGEVNPPVVNANTHSVNVKVNVKGGGTRLSEGDAIGQTPQLADLTLFFVDQTLNKVNAVVPGALGTITTTGQTVPALPGGTSALYIVGNLGNVASASIAAITNASSETDLKQAILDVTGQYTAGTPTYEHVNVFGFSTYSLPVGSNTGTLALDITPAISRLQIAKVEADGSVPAKAITGFDLAGIFINNTYKNIGVDNTIYPTAAANIIAYPDSDPVWATPATYPAEYCGLNLGTGPIATPVPVTDRWAYYVAPAAKQVGGNYVGEQIAGVQYDAKPVIVVKLENVVYDAAVPAADRREPAYITITKLKDGVNYIDHFERGKVYDISNIKFDVSNITGTPMTPPVHSLDVTVTVKPWVGVTTEPELN